MFRIMMKSKIHRATVTEANVDYVGSITIDSDLMKAADLLPNEKVQVADITNGARLETYVIEGPRGVGRRLPERRGRAPGRGRGQGHRDQLRDDDRRRGPRPRPDGRLRRRRQPDHLARPEAHATIAP